ncbi:hypothetical protein N836_13555 [Leptolyngbya sp. Heron Island J]|uniref:hypothetical protein n=1 Tax=Leptolyngbya sp. Heron Island J TaxID=1385935 RepID=UPI0003B9A000|nr:hypothetical protein [Leptolyngbya sp. Heron Island J]ESA35086.1 hypothetical protein N836_13555 [Leptolyngbya sp. Heron Island J]
MLNIFKRKKKVSILDELSMLDFDMPMPQLEDRESLAYKAYKKVSKPLLQLNPLFREAEIEAKDEAIKADSTYMNKLLEKGTLSKLRSGKRFLLMQRNKMLWKWAGMFDSFVVNQTVFIPMLEVDLSGIEQLIKDINAEDVADTSTGNAERGWLVEIYSAEIEQLIEGDNVEGVTDILTGEIEQEWFVVNERGYSTEDNTDSEEE